MAFPRKHLYNDEQIVIDRYPHWWFLAPRALVLVAASAFGIWLLSFYNDPERGGGGLETTLKYFAAFAVALALVAFAVRLIGWRSTNFVVTTERCIYRSGVLRKTGIEIPLDRINAVFFSQTILERMLGKGDLAIESAGENSRQEFSDVRKPVEVQNTIYQQMEENENRKFLRIGDEARSAARGAAGAARPLSVAEQLEKLADLHERGVIDDQQFEAQKAQLLGGPA